MAHQVVRSQSGLLLRGSDSHDRRLTRRRFLVGSGLATLGLALARLVPLAPCAVAATDARPLASLPSYGDWRDVYERKWTWDRVVKSSHFTNCWYQSHCAWNVYVKDGVVWREEQVADYPQTNAEVPDYNPRGCQKGACYSERMADPARVRYPLKRVGPRGSGKWKRVSWDEALEDLAEEFIRIVREEGSDRIIWDNGPLFTMGAMAVAQLRFTYLAGNVTLDMNTEIGDGHRGAAETFGKIVFERTADDYFNSDLILIWGSNPLYTQIPNAHFLTEARYKGATIITIAPDYSASSIHSDAWLPIRPGTDAALALAIARVMIDENLYDEAFVKEQTDLPLLVRDDNNRFLRQSDLKEGGSEDVVYWFDTRTQRPVEVPRDKLGARGVELSLEGRFEIETLGGRVSVRPVFEKLRQRLRDYRPRTVASICGIPERRIVDLARRIATAKAATNVTGSNFSKYYHGNLVERSMALVFTLAGHIGRKGGGFVAFPFLTNDGFEPFAMGRTGLLDTARLWAQIVPKKTWLKWQGYSEEMVAYEMSRAAYEQGLWTSGTLFWNIHGGILDYSGRSKLWDPHLKRPVAEYLKESLDKAWQYLTPSRGSDPRMLISFASNILRRVRAYPLLLEHLWPKLTRVVVLDWRMTSTGLFADYVLPVAAWYERNDHKWVTPLMPFLHAGEKAVGSGQAWHEWRILTRFARAISQAAERMGVDRYKDHNGNERSLKGLYREFTYEEKFDEHAESKVAEAILAQSTNLGDVKWQAVQKRGYTPFTSPGKTAVSIGNATRFEPGKTATPLTRHVHDKEPYPTLTRRIQFYIDHPFYLELDEALPRHKEPPSAGGDYPLLLSGGHTRWSIHAQWRDDALMLQQQRGEPVMYMSVDDARSRGIRDADTVVVRNDLDSFHVQAKVSPAVRPGQLILYHAWENYQFRDGKGFQNLIPSPINPVELAGGQYHLRPMLICLQPGQFDRDTRVEVARA